MKHKITLMTGEEVEYEIIKPDMDKSEDKSDDEDNDNEKENECVGCAGTGCYRCDPEIKKKVDKDILEERRDKNNEN